MSIPSFPPYPHPEDESNEKDQIDREEALALPSDGQAQPDGPMSIEDQLEPPPSIETELPAEAQGEANGGPLGCCLGVIVGIMLSLFLGVIGFGRVTANVLVFVIHADAITNIRIATALFAVIGVIVGGYCGWKIGKRVYREYELSPRRQQRLAKLEQRHKRKTRSQPKRAKV